MTTTTNTTTTNTTSSSITSSEDYADNEPIETDILLPDLTRQSFSLDPNIPIIDTLLLISKELRILPGDHQLIPFYPNSNREYWFKVSQKIGNFRDADFHLVNKKNLKTKKQSQDNVEVLKQRIHIDLPHNQIHVTRILPTENFYKLLKQVCQEKNLDENVYVICRPDRLDEPLAWDLCIEDVVGDSNNRRFTFLAVFNDTDGDQKKGDDYLESLDLSNRHIVNTFTTTTMEYMPNETKKKKKGFFSIFSRKKKDKFNTSAVSSKSTITRPKSTTTKDNITRSSSMYLEGGNNNQQQQFNTSDRHSHYNDHHNLSSTGKKKSAPPPPPHGSMQQESNENGKLLSTQNTSLAKSLPSINQPTALSTTSSTMSSTIHSRKSSTDASSIGDNNPVPRPSTKKKKAPAPPIPTLKKQQEETIVENDVPVVKDMELKVEKKIEIINDENDKREELNIVNESQTDNLSIQKKSNDTSSSSSSSPLLFSQKSKNCINIETKDFDKDDNNDVVEENKEYNKVELRSPIGLNKGKARPKAFILPPPPDEPPPDESPSPRASFLAASISSLDKIDSLIIENKLPQPTSSSIGSQIDLDDFDDDFPPAIIAHQVTNQIENETVVVSIVNNEIENGDDNVTKMIELKEEERIENLILTPPSQFDSVNYEMPADDSETNITIIEKELIDSRRFDDKIHIESSPPITNEYRQEINPSPPPFTDEILGGDSDDEVPIEERFVWDDSCENNTNNATSQSVPIIKEAQEIATVVEKPVEKPIEKEIEQNAVDADEIPIGNLRSVLRNKKSILKNNRSAQSAIETDTHLKGILKQEDWSKNGLWANTDSGLRHVDERNKVGQTKIYAATKPRPISADISIDVSKILRSPNGSMDEEKDEGYDSYSGKKIKTSTPIQEEIIKDNSFYSPSVITTSSSSSCNKEVNDSIRHIRKLDLTGETEERNSTSTSTSTVSISHSEQVQEEILRSREEPERLKDAVYMEKLPMFKRWSSVEPNENGGKHNDKASVNEKKKIIKNTETVTNNEPLHISTIYIGGDDDAPTTTTMPSNKNESDDYEINELNVDDFVNNLTSAETSEDETSSKGKNVQVESSIKGNTTTAAVAPTAQVVDVKDSIGGYSHTKQTNVDDLQLNQPTNSTYSNNNYNNPEIVSILRKKPPQLQPSSSIITTNSNTAEAKRSSLQFLTAKPFTNTTNRTTRTITSSTNRKSGDDYRKEYDAMQEKLKEWQNRLKRNEEVLENVNNNDALTTTTTTTTNKSVSSPTVLKRRSRDLDRHSANDAIGLFGQFTPTQLSSMKERLKHADTIEKNKAINVGKVVDDVKSNTNIKSPVTRQWSAPEKKSSSNIPNAPPPQPPTQSPMSVGTNRTAATKPPPIGGGGQSVAPKALNLKSGIENKPKSKFGPQLDPYEELMLSIKSVNGRGALRKVETTDCHWTDTPKL